MLYTARLFNNEPITSPNYPSPYGSIGGVCQWLIESAYLDDRSYILKVVFNDFELEKKTYSCLHVHNLQFYDGPSTASDHLGSYCGTSHPDVIYTTGPYLLVRFEALRSFRGFSFNVSLVKRGTCSYNNYYCFNVCTLLLCLALTNGSFLIKVAKAF